MRMFIWPTRCAKRLIWGLVLGSAIMQGQRAAAQSMAPALAVDGVAVQGKAVAARPGQAISVELSGQPGTGYAWEVREPLPRFLKAKDVERLPNPQSMPGSWERQRFAFQIEAEGESELVFLYRRSWEALTGKEQVYRVHLVVK